ncbi:hypothetical protein [Amorphus orientalis]|uniref:Uncharacterized protein n=1 Tax=Amorphus orientalis TaxID=649198 RepID=A0AAE3VSA7_9HYPH|nr:hypothetical protein [Amorphus orientalis]MDQ0317447.1 hypothetical protein [Amorphus orientalis]
MGRCGEFSAGWRNRRSTMSPDVEGHPVRRSLSPVALILAAAVCAPTSTFALDGTSWRDAPRPEFVLLGKGNEGKYVDMTEAVTLGPEWSVAAPGATRWGSDQAVVLGGFMSSIPAVEVFADGFATSTRITLSHEETRKRPYEDEWGAVYPWSLHATASDRPVIRAWRDREEGVVVDVAEASEDQVTARLLGPRLGAADRNDRVIDLAQGHGVRALAVELGEPGDMRVRVAVARAEAEAEHTLTPSVSGGRVMALDVTLTPRDNDGRDFQANTLSLLLAGERRTDDEEPTAFRDPRDSVGFLELVQTPLSRGEAPISRMAVTFSSADMLPRDWRPFVERGEIQVRLAGVQTLTERLTDTSDAVPVWLVYEVELSSEAADSPVGGDGVLIARLDWENDELRLRHRRAIVLNNSGLRHATLRSFEVTDDGVAGVLVSRDWAQMGPRQQVLALLAPDLSVTAALDAREVFERDAEDPDYEPVFMNALFVTPSAELGLVTSTRTYMFDKSRAAIYAVRPPGGSAPVARTSEPVAGTITEEPVTGTVTEETAEVEIAEEPPERSNGSLRGMTSYEALGRLLDALGDLEAAEPFYSEVAPCPELLPVPSASDPTTSRVAFVESYNARRDCLMDRKTVFFEEFDQAMELVQRAKDVSWAWDVQPRDVRNGYVLRWNRSIDRHNAEKRDAEEVINRIESDLEAALTEYDQLP